MQRVALLVVLATTVACGSHVRELAPSPSRTASTARLAPSGAITMPTTAELSAPSTDAIWALIASSALFRSADRGRTWQQRPLPSDMVPCCPARIAFADSQHGWVMAESSPETQCQQQAITIWATPDGGATWKILDTSGIAQSQCKSGVSFVDPSHGFVTAWDPNHRPVIYRTVDGGVSWLASQPLPDPPGQATQLGGLSLRPQSVARVDGTLLVGAWGWQRTYVYGSTDGGGTWSYAATVSGANDTAMVAFADSRRWWATGGGIGIAFTADAGATWRPPPSAPPSAAPVPVELVFADAQVGYATVRGQIWRTDDGGAHWTELHTPGTG